MTIAEAIQQKHSFDGIYMLRSVNFGTTAKGTEYVRAVLGDATGSAGAVQWDVGSDEKKLWVEGTAVRVGGVVKQYQGAPQLNVVDIRELSDQAKAALDMTTLYERAPRPINDMWSELLDVIGLTTEEIGCGFLNDIRDWMNVKSGLEGCWERFRLAPAARKMHHAYIGGLLEHTLGVVRIVFDLYTGSCQGNFDPGVAIAGALLHDIGKIEEYELSGKITTSGKLVGHIQVGYALVTSALAMLDIDSLINEKIGHCILAHHGCPEWGSPVTPKTIDAFIVHQADTMDVRLWEERRCAVIPGEWHDSRIFGGELYTG